MLACIKDNHHIYFEQVTQGSEDALISWFSVRDPKAYFINKDASNGYDGWTRRYSIKHQRVYLPYLDEVKLCCQFHRIPLEIRDERPSPTYPAPRPDQITNTLLNGITLEQYQVDSLRVACEKDIGIFDLTTGAGKTELIAGIVKMFRCPSVIITEQIVVLNQIVARLSMRGVVHRNDIGMFCHGHMPDGNLVIVGSIQSISTPSKPDKGDITFTIKQLRKRLLSSVENEDKHLSEVFPKKLLDVLNEFPEGIDKLPEKYLALYDKYLVESEWEMRKKSYETRLENAMKIQDMIKECDLALVDEADLATSAQYSMLFRSYFKGRRRYGFSGTPFNNKKPVNNLILKGNLGSTIFKVERNVVEAAGRIIPVKCYWIVYGNPLQRFDSRTYDIALKEDIIDNVDFHNIVKGIVDRFPDDGTLILIDTSPIAPLGEALEELIPNSKFIYGKTSNKERDKYLKAFEQRELKVLIGSKILRRGLDLDNGVENLIVIGGGGDWSDLTQKVGRSVRLNKRGWARVFGFFTLTNKYLYKHSRENLKAVVDLGYPTKVIGQGIDTDGSDLIKSRFHFRINK